MTTIVRVSLALDRANLRGFVGNIEANPATAGEVVLWIDGAGYPVQTATEAVQVVRRVVEDASEE